MKYLLMGSFGAAFPMISFNADGAQSGSSQTAGAASQAGGTDPAKGQTQTGTGEQGKQTADPDFKKKFEDLERSHNEQKTKWQKREEEDAKAKEKALADQGKYKELFDKTKSDLDSLTAQNEAKDKALTKYFEIEVKALPDNIKSLMPEGDVVAKLEWIAKAKEAGAAAAGEKKASGDGSPAPGAAKAADFTAIYTKKA